MDLLNNYPQEFWSFLPPQALELVSDWRLFGRVTFVTVSCCILGKGLKFICQTLLRSLSISEEVPTETLYDEDNPKKSSLTRVKRVAPGPADPTHIALLFKKLKEKSNQLYQLEDEIHKVDKTIHLSKENLNSLQQVTRREGELRKCAENEVSMMQSKLDKQKRKNNQHESDMQALTTELSYYLLEIELRKEGLSPEIAQKIQLLEASEKQRNSINRLRQTHNQELKKRIEERELTNQLEQKKKQLLHEKEKLSAKMEFLSYQNPSPPRSPSFAPEPPVVEDEEQRKTMVDDDEEGCKRFLILIKEDHKREHI